LMSSYGDMGFKREKLLGEGVLVVREN
jgi:hypothetical protein